MSYYAIEYSYSRPVDQTFSPFPRHIIECEHMPWCLLKEVVTREEALEALKKYRERRDPTVFGIKIFRAVLQEGEMNSQ